MNIHKQFNNKGEVASLLTVFSMLVIGVGLLVGFNVSKQEEALNTTPFAQEASQYRPITEPNRLADHVCFPVGDKNNRVIDPFCRSRLHPADFDDVERNADPTAASNFRALFSAVNPENMHIIPVTAENPRTARAFGGICQTSRSNSPTTTNSTKVWLSLFDVRKMENINDPEDVKAQESDINEAKNFEIVAADKTTGGRNSLMFANASQDMCLYRIGTNPNTEELWEPTNEDNPLLFTFDINLDALEDKINLAKQEPTDGVRERVFDTKECSLYVHLDSNDRDAPKDTYNIFRLPLEDVVGEEEKARLCPEPSPTPTDVPTATPESSPTPSATPVPRLAKCFEPEDPTQPGCGPQVGCEPTNEAGEPLRCYEVGTVGGGGGGGIPIPSVGRPGDPVTESTGNRRSSGSDDSTIRFSNPTALDTCDEGETCRCLPARCLTEDCSTKEKACTIITPSPTATPSPTPQEVVCRYDALAFIEECTNVIKSGPHAGECESDPTIPGRFQAKPIDKKVLTDQWAPLNDKQIEGGSYTNTNDSGEIISLKDTKDVKFKFLGSSPIESASLLDTFGKTNTSGRNVFGFLTSDMLVKGLTFRETSHIIDLNPGDDPLTADISIPLYAEDDPRNLEVYKNHQESADVTFFYDRENYRVVNKGNKVYSCTNADKGIEEGVAACKTLDSGSLDVTRGLTVGCGQKIIYGVTLQKCDFNYDYLFVVDTSTSMNLTDPLTESTKMEAVKQSLRDQFVPDIRNGKGSQSRFSMITFNSGPTYFADKEQFRAVNGFVDINDGAVDTAISGLNPANLNQQGTCFQCALELAEEVIEARKDTSRRPVIVLLTDGNPNSKLKDNGDGTRGPVDNEDTVVLGLADNLKTDIDNLTLVTVGYGDTKLENNDPSNPEAQRFSIMIKGMASTKKKDASKKWAYSTNTTLAREEGGGSINEVMSDVQADLNTCAEADVAQRELLKAKDINGDGIINAIDLLLLYDNYSARGQEIPEDVNKDEHVNALDVSLVVEDLGTVIEDDDIQGGLTVPSGLDTTPNDTTLAQ